MKKKLFFFIAFIIANSYSSEWGKVDNQLQNTFSTIRKQSSKNKQQFIIDLIEHRKSAGLKTLVPTTDKRYQSMLQEISGFLDGYDNYFILCDQISPKHYPAIFTY
jgi:hypothetical protein